MIQESFLWIRNCINSSTNKFHLDSCEVLISLFSIKFEHEGECSGMTNDLKLLLREKETSLIITA